MTAERLLEVADLTVEFSTPAGRFCAVENLGFDVGRGEIVGLVGESGCGKTVASLAFLGLLPREARVLSGSVRLEGTDLLAIPPREMRRIRGRKIAMIFQDPLSALNPVLTCGEQVGEVLALDRRVPPSRVRERACGLLGRVGLGADVFDAYPHQLSGGMRQRVMIAMALAGEPLLLLADEPTTALDVTIQAQTLSLLRRLRREQGLTVLLISHDLALVSESCDRVVVMYAGRVVEAAGATEIFVRPLHPYTRALLACIPSLDGPPVRPRPIPGEVPAGIRRDPGCTFRPRCPEAGPECGRQEPALVELGAGRWVRCARRPGEDRGDA